MQDIQPCTGLICMPCPAQPSLGLNSAQPSSPRLLHQDCGTTATPPRAASSLLDRPASGLAALTISRAPQAPLGPRPPPPVPTRIYPPVAPSPACSPALYVPKEAVCTALSAPRTIPCHRLARWAVWGKTAAAAAAAVAAPVTLLLHHKRLCCHGWQLVVSCKRLKHRENIVGGQHGSTRCSGKHSLLSCKGGCTAAEVSRPCYLQCRISNGNSAGSKVRCQLLCCRVRGRLHQQVGQTGHGLGNNKVPGGTHDAGEHRA